MPIRVSTTFYKSNCVSLQLAVSYKWKHTAALFRSCFLQMDFYHQLLENYFCSIEIQLNIKGNGYWLNGKQPQQRIKIVKLEFFDLDNREKPFSSYLRYYYR